MWNNVILMGLAAVLALFCAIVAVCVVLVRRANRERDAEIGRAHV